MGVKNVPTARMTLTAICESPLTAPSERWLGAASEMRMKIAPDNNARQRRAQRITTHSTHHTT